MEAMGIIWKNNSGITYCSWQTGLWSLPQQLSHLSLVPRMSAPVILAYRTLTHDPSCHDDPSSSIFLPKTSFSLIITLSWWHGFPIQCTWVVLLLPSFQTFTETLIFEAPNSARKGGDKKKRVRGKTYQMRRLTVKFLDSGWNRLGAHI